VVERPPSKGDGGKAGKNTAGTLLSMSLIVASTSRCWILECRFAASFLVPMFPSLLQQNDHQKCNFLLILVPIFPLISLLF
jgi:hypothetical protein